MNPINFSYNPLYFGNKSPKKPKLEHPENGTITVVNKKGDEYTLTYKDNKISSVYKNGEFYKKYYYSKQRMPNSLYPSHTFKDGSKIDEAEFYSIGETENTSVLLGSIKHSISTIRNKNAKYKNEPIMVIEKHNAGEDKKMTTIRKTDGPEKFEFETLDEAKEYFLSEYGIEANFSNLCQAFFMKEAIDEIVKLNYKGKGKRYFEGMIIDSKAIKSIHGDNYNVFANMSVNNIWIDIPDGEVNPGNWDEILRRIELLPDEGVMVAESIITINNDNNWDDVQRDLIINKKRTAAKLIKELLIHELIHYIHAKESAKCFLLSQKKIAPEDIKAASEVSTYGSTAESGGKYAEFIAEYGTGRMAGRTYSKETNELYKKWGGPDLWGDLNA